MDVGRDARGLTPLYSEILYFAINFLVGKCFFLVSELSLCYFTVVAPTGKFFLVTPQKIHYCSPEEILLTPTNYAPDRKLRKCKESNETKEDRRGICGLFRAGLTFSANRANAAGPRA